MKFETFEGKKINMTPEEWEQHEKAEKRRKILEEAEEIKKGIIKEVEETEKLSEEERTKRLEKQMREIEKKAGE